MKLTKKQVLDRFQRRMNGDYEFTVSQYFVISEWEVKKMKTRDLKDAIRHQLGKLRQSIEIVICEMGKDLDL